MQRKRVFYKIKGLIDFIFEECFHIAGWFGFAIVMLLDYYINDQYIDQVLQILNNIKLDKYYVQMANAWTISICLIKYYNKTLEFLKTTKIDDFTYNKGIQKAIESYRITKEQKDYLKTLKRGK